MDGRVLLKDHRTAWNNLSESLNMFKCLYWRTEFLLYVSDGDLLLRSYILMTINIHSTWASPKSVHSMNSETKRDFFLNIKQLIGSFWVKWIMAVGHYDFEVFTAQRPCTSPSADQVITWRDEPLSR